MYKNPKNAFSESYIYDDRKNIPNIYHHQEDSRVLLEKKQQLHWLFQYWKRSSIYWNYVKLDAFYVLTSYPQRKMK